MPQSPNPGSVTSSWQKSKKSKLVTEKKHQTLNRTRKRASSRKCSWTKRKPEKSTRKQSGSPLRSNKWEDVYVIFHRSFVSHSHTHLLSVPVPLVGTACESEPKKQLNQREKERKAVAVERSTCKTTLLFSLFLLRYLIALSQNDAQTALIERKLWMLMIDLNALTHWLLL